MANKVPAPVLDTRDGDAVTAQAIGSLPAELSDRSNSNPAVAIIESTGVMFDKLLYQINRWPSAVVQKLLNLVGITLSPATAATVTQTFTLAAPQPQDTLIPKSTQVGNPDGTVSFATLYDLTIAAYGSGGTPGAAMAGTISMTAGSTAVTGSGTSLGLLAPGYQISTDKNTWYTVATVADSFNITLTAPAAATVTGSTFYGGPISGTVLAQATAVGSAGNVPAGTLTAYQNQPAGLQSTTNTSPASGGADEETIDAAVARASTSFAVRDVAVTTSDFEAFATAVLGVGGRARAAANTNVTTVSQPSYVTVALLSPSWTAAAPVTTQERASVIRDLSGRVFSGATVVDVAANVQSFTSGSSVPAALVIRKASYDEASVRANIAASVNTMLNPNVYDWGRTVYATDLVQAVESATGVDRVVSLNGVPCVAMNWNTTAGTISYINNSATATCSSSPDASAMVAGQTVLVDATNKAAYLVTAKSGTTLTLHTAFTGASATVSSVNYMNVGDKTLANWYSLPYSALSTSTSSPPASVLVLGKY